MIELAIIIVVCWSLYIIFNRPLFPGDDGVA